MGKWVGVMELWGGEELGSSLQTSTEGMGLGLCSSACGRISDVKSLEADEVLCVCVCVCVCVSQRTTSDVIPPEPSHPQSPTLRGQVHATMPVFWGIWDDS